MIETSRLLLKQYTYEMVDVIHPVVAQAEVADTMIAIPHPYPKDFVYTWIDYLHASEEKGSAREFAVFLKDKPNIYIGNCGLVSISELHKNAEVGYFFDKNYWGNGYATEVTAAITQLGFDTLGLERIYGYCMSRNIASRKVMENCGLVHEGTLRHAVKKNSAFEDLDVLSIIRSDYYKVFEAQ